VDVARGAVGVADEYANGGAVGSAVGCEGFFPRKFREPKLKFEVGVEQLRAGGLGSAWIDIQYDRITTRSRRLWFGGYPSTGAVDRVPVDKGARR